MTPSPGFYNWEDSEKWLSKTSKTLVNLRKSPIKHFSEIKDKTGDLPFR
jgi:hypothetical protein